MMHFIKDGYRKKTEQDRVNFGIQLKQALDEFTDSFLPHMQEEEEVYSFLKPCALYANVNFGEFSKWCIMLEINKLCLVCAGISATAATIFQL